MYQPEIVYDALAPEGERLVLEVYTYILPYIPIYSRIYLYSSVYTYILSYVPIYFRMYLYTFVYTYILLYIPVYLRI
jgi:hypothetical protein